MATSVPQTPSTLCFSSYVYWADCSNLTPRVSKPAHIFPLVYSNALSENNKNISGPYSLLHITEVAVTIN